MRSAGGIAIGGSKYSAALPIWAMVAALAGAAYVAITQGAGEVRARMSAEIQSARHVGAAWIWRLWVATRSGTRTIPATMIGGISERGSRQRSVTFGDVPVALPIPARYLVLRGHPKQHAFLFDQAATE